MQDQDSTTIQAVPIRNGIVSLSGYGVRVLVDRGHLTVCDGVGRQRRRGRFPKAVSRIRRLIITANTGFISFEALRWLRDAGTAVVHLDYDGAVTAEPARRLDDARLRRAQALAFHSPLRARIAHTLLRAKIEAQLAVMHSFDLGKALELERALADMGTRNTLEAALRAEAQAAEAYWQAWADISIVYARRDKVPEHWRSFAIRQSPLSLSTRKAINPANAMLNYLYTLLEAEARIALIARGLDSGLGFFHADIANRSSLADDVMEPVRPHVDAHMLSLLQARTFSAKDFVEMRDGTCRLTIGLTRELAQTMPTWARLVEPHAEALTRALASFAKTGSATSALTLSRAEQSGRLKVRSKPIAVSVPAVRKAIPVSQFKNVCRSCGAPLTIRKRVYCDACLPAERERMQRDAGAAFQAAGPAKIARLRMHGFDPTNTAAAKNRRIATATLQRRAVTAWIDDGSLEAVDFARDILPELQNKSVRQIAEAMDACLSYGSKVRNGHVTPHKRHWHALRDISRRYSAD